MSIPPSSGLNSIEVSATDVTQAEYYSGGLYIAFVALIGIST